MQTETQIPEFAPRGWREIKGKGWLAMVDCDRDRPVMILVSPGR